MTLRTSDMTLRYDPPDLRYDPPRLVPRWSRDGPEMASDTHIQDPSQTAVSKEAVLSVLLTIAEVFRVSSKDWIAPPTCFGK